MFLLIILILILILILIFIFSRFPPSYEFGGSSILDTVRFLICSSCILIYGQCQFTIILGTRQSQPGCWSNRIPPSSWESVMATKRKIDSASSSLVVTAERAVRLHHLLRLLSNGPKPRAFLQKSVGWTCVDSIETSVSSARPELKCDWKVDSIPWWASSRPFPIACHSPIRN